jgi:hypothetical protein
MEKGESDRGAGVDDVRCRAPGGVHLGRHLLVGAFSALEPALYFSTVTFATLGYGDITLNESWRLLASFEAANGIIMFGWTTALIFAVVQRLAAYDQARVAEPENGPSLTKR